ncbi:hypothetical protein EG329_003099 [Mollisiaceae sp. DMI_Dod_QoI]|nr:hypothetical protein EG329_003099 [Helotiales sp. DMI_Dod_QoI]
MAFEISFDYGSHNISFSEWVTLITLCLAPLIAHIAAGVPQPIYLHNKRPSWHQRICHYNPTSILWRYLAIIDRRCRATSWSPLDVAASNALFWDGSKWDGSEAMIQRSRDLCIRAPNHHHIDPLSMSTVVTLVVTLQGVQALYSLVDNVQGSYALTVSVSTIFYPLATLGLLRLPAALWLTNDFAYRHVEDWESPGTTELELRPSLRKGSSSALVTQPTISSLHEPIISNRFHSPRVWRSIAIKAFYLMMVLGLLVVCIFLLVGKAGTSNNSSFFTTTNLTLNLLFLFFLAVTVGTLLYYVLLGRCNTTIIPCITAGWYKIYTGILFTAMLGVFIVAAIETRETPCGHYTTYARNSDTDWEICGPSTYIETSRQQAANSTFVDDSQNSTQLSLNHTSIITMLFDNSYGLALSAGEGEIVVMAFNGWCMINNDFSPSDFTMFERMNSTINIS